MLCIAVALSYRPYTAVHTCDCLAPECHLYISMQGDRVLIGGLCKTYTISSGAGISHNTARGVYICGDHIVMTAILQLIRRTEVTGMGNILELRIIVFSQRKADFKCFYVKE